MESVSRFYLMGWMDYFRIASAKIHCERMDYLLDFCRAIFIGIYNGQPAFIGTVDQDTGRNPTAIGIINDLRFSWGENFNSARRLLPSSAYIYNHQLPDHMQQPPVIPKSRVLPLPKTIKTIVERKQLTIVDRLPLERLIP